MNAKMFLFICVEINQWLLNKSLSKSAPLVYLLSKTGGLGLNEVHMPTLNIYYMDILLISPFRYTILRRFATSEMVYPHYLKIGNGSNLT